MCCILCYKHPLQVLNALYSVLKFITLGKLPIMHCVIYGSDIVIVLHTADHETELLLLWFGS